MSKNDSPAGSAGGPVTLPDLDALPEKMRVHALAKMIGVTSREILAALSGLGHEARSAQSSIERKVVEQIIGALVPGVADSAGVADPAADPGVAGHATAGPGAGEPAAAVNPAGGPGPAAALAPIFAPPAPLFQAPVRIEPAEEVPSEAPAPRRRRRGKVEEPPAAEETIATDTATDTTAEDADADSAGDIDGADDSDESDESARRRRRRGRRGRGRGRGGDESDENETESDAGDESDEDTEDDETEPETEGSRRRRRRRRRRGSGDDATDAPDDDPPGTVTRIRAPRESRDDSTSDGDGVQSVRGSTRLEAKRQRRRDGRDAGRRRQPILSEAEFLARRESVERTMVVRERGSRVEIGVLEDDVLVEHFVTGRDGGSLVGNIYLGRVQNVLPSMEAAFVDIGRGRNAVLYAGEVDWDAAGLGGKARRIEQALSTGDSVLVQVTKDPIGHKGARLTTQISLAGRFLVYVPSGGAAGISRKLPDVERRRLKDMLRDIVPSEAGVIIRTASEGVSQEALERDVRRLQAQWEVVKTKSEQTGPSRPKAPALLYEEPDLLIKVVRDQFNEDFSRLVVQGDDAWDTLYGYLAHVAHELADRMHRHVGKEDVFNAYRIDEQLLKALDRKVWLPSGGTLVIDRTEAMTVIDVNTGKFTGSGGNLEETVTRNNLEAAEEIVRQLRLRDIGGIIVVDFIDMVLEANRDLVLRRLTECLARDRTRHQVAEVTSLGLVQMTRKRVGGGLLEHFSTPCEHCRGRGVIIDTEAIEHPEPAKSDTGGGRKARGGRGRRGDGETNGQQGNGRSVNGSGAGGSDTGSVGDHSAVVAATAVIAAAGNRSGGTVEAAPSVGDGELADVVDVAAAAAAVADAAVVEAAVVDSVAGDTAAVESVAVTSAPVGSAPAGSAPVGSGPVGSAPVGSAPVGSAPVGSAPVGSAPAGSAPAGSAAVDAAGIAPAPAAEASAASIAPAGHPADDGPAEPPAPRRRRGRVTRTAGAPTVTEGEAPAAAVVTVPVVTGPAAASSPATSPAAGASAADPVADVAPTVVPQPEPTAASRPRRGRRAASRPAGPPSEANGDAAEGDPV